MMPVSKTLMNLPRDILLDIFSRCDVGDLLSTEQTCKKMYDLCRSREIWVFRLKNLDIDQAPCFAPYEWLGDLSTEVIRRKVIQAIRTSEKWAKPEALRVSDLATLKLTPRMLPYRISCPNRLKPEVVAGGEFVIIENQGQLELWSTLFSEKLWVSLTPGEPLFCHSFGSELQHGGEVLVIAAVYVDYLSGKSTLRVHHLPLSALDDRCISCSEMSVPFLAPISVRGDIITNRHPVDSLISLCDWRTASSITLSFRNEQQRVDITNACLTDTHLLVTLHLGTFTLLALPLSSLSGVWSASSSDEPAHLDIDLEPATLSNACPVDGTGLDILRFNLTEPTDQIDGPWAVTMHAFTPPWKVVREHDVPTEIFVVAHEKKGTGIVDALLSWRLQLSCVSPPCASEPKDTWRFSLVSKARARSSILPQSAQTISNNGRMLSFSCGVKCFQLFSDKQQPITVLEPEERDPIDYRMNYSLESLDPYSGVLAIRTPGKVKVVEFR